MPARASDYWERIHCRGEGRYLSSEKILEFSKQIMYIPFFCLDVSAGVSGKAVKLGHLVLQ